MVSGSSIFGERRRQRALQSDRQHLVHVLDEVQLHRVAQIFRHFGQVLLVVLGQDDLEDPAR